jgi:hypothetical protein
MLPAYAGLIGSVGLGFLMETAYLLPLIVVFLVLAIAALGFRARRRKGYAPFAMGLAGATSIILGKFIVDSSGLVYGGVAALAAASLWNAWPVRPAPGVPSPPMGTLYQIGRIEEEN